MPATKYWRQDSESSMDNQKIQNNPEKNEMVFLIIDCSLLTKTEWNNGILLQNM